MAKFRRQHGSGSRGGGVFSGRLVSVFIIMVFMIVGTLYFAKSDLLKLRYKEKMFLELNDSMLTH